jgi:hypothetical protein
MGWGCWDDEIMNVMDWIIPSNSLRLAPGNKCFFCKTSVSDMQTMAMMALDQNFMVLVQPGEPEIRRMLL